MGLFHIIPDAVAITRTKGVYKQVKVYHRDNELFIGHGVGFLRLYASDRGTSHPDIYLEEIQVPFKAEKGTYGYMTLPVNYKAIDITPPKQKVKKK